MDLHTLHRNRYKRDILNTRVRKGGEAKYDTTQKQLITINEAAIHKKNSAKTHTDIQADTQSYEQNHIHTYINKQTNNCVRHVVEG